MINGKFSIQQREEGKRLINKAIEFGILEKPHKCYICGQTEGILEYYITDYRPQCIITNAQPICWTCHRMLLLQEIFEKQAEQYFRNVNNGIKPIPVHDDNLAYLKRYGIKISSMKHFGIDKI